VYCGSCGALITSKFCTTCGTAAGADTGSGLGLGLSSSPAGPGKTVPQTMKDRLLVEMGKEHVKLNAKADKLRKSDPSASFHLHHAVGNAISSLSASKKAISSVEDLKGIKGFGPHVLSLARTCLHRIWAADPLLSPRPRRPRVKSITRTYTPRVGSQAFAVMCIARRHDGCTMEDFARFNDEFGYSSSPFVQGQKGWSNQPLAQLTERGLVVGGFESGWTLTDIGEDIADRALQKWDSSAEEQGDDDDNDNGDDDEGGGKEEKKEHTKEDKKDSKTSSHGKGKKRSKRQDDDEFFGDLEIIDDADGWTSPIAKKPHREQKAAPSSGSGSAAGATPPASTATAAAAPTPTSSSTSASASSREADEKVK